MKGCVYNCVPVSQATHLGLGKRIGASQWWGLDRRGDLSAPEVQGFSHREVIY